MRLEFEQNVLTLPPIDHEIDARGETAVTSNPNDALMKGVAAAQSGNRVQARILLKLAVQLDPASEAGWLWLASISEYPEELLIFLGEVLSINPENARALEWKNATQLLLAKTFVQRGIEAANEGRSEFAMQCFDSALAHDEQNQLAWFWKTSLSDDQAKTAEPVDDRTIYQFETAEEEPPPLTREQSIEAVFHAAQSSYVSGDRDRAMHLIDEITTEDPDSEKAWMLRSHVTENPEEKMRSLEKVLEINPENIVARAGLDCILAEVETVTPDVADNEVKDADANRFISLQAIAIPSEKDVHENVPTQDLELPESVVTNNPFLTKAEDEHIYEFSAVEDTALSSFDEGYPAIESPVFSTDVEDVQPVQWSGYQVAEPDSFTSDASPEWSPSTIHTYDDSAFREVADDLHVEEVQEPACADTSGTTETESYYSDDDDEAAIEINAAESLSQYEEMSHHAASESNQSTRTILVVDDNPTVRKLIASKLEGSGYRVVSAASGKEAISAIAGFRPDLVLLDVGMPKMDGYQVCEQIRKNDATRDVPVVMIAGKDGPYDDVRGDKAGATTFISKPFGPEALMKTMNAYLPSAY